MLKTAIVILNWNTKDYLKKFLPAVLETTESKNSRVFVADNASTDGSAEMLENEFPDVEVIRLDKNYGFAEGYNRALARIEAEYFLLLNSDVQVTQNWLPPLVKTLDSDPLIAACSPKIKSFDNNHFFEYAGAAGGFIDKYGYAFCQGRIFDSVEADYGQYDRGREVFWTTGACMLVRGPLFKIAGGFDAEFFAHFEEIDLCWRLKNRGYKFRYVPESSVLHIGGGTLPVSNPRKTYFNFRNNLMAIYKNYSPGQLRMIIFIRLVMDGFSAFRFLTKFKFRDILAILRAHLGFYGSLGRLRKFRQGEKKFINNFHHREMYPKSIVREFFLKKKYTFLTLKWLIS